MPTYDVPGVYIQEITGPGVITGVGTSTAGFIGPALAGQFNVALRINSWDEFLSNYGILQPDGVTYWAYITAPKWFYMAPAVRSFFQNGGQHAYIVRIGTGQSTVWNITNQNTPADIVFRLQAKQQGVAGDNITVNLQQATSTAAGGIGVATAVAKVTKVEDTLNFDVDDSSQFRAGDIITKVATPESLLDVDRAQIALITGNHITLLSALSTALTAGTDHIQLASIKQTQTSFRMGTSTPKYLAPGSVVLMNGYDPANLATQLSDYVVIQSIDQAGFVTPASTPGRTNAYSTASGAAAPPSLTPQEFKLIIAVPGGATETFDNLSLNPIHPNYVFAILLNSNLVNILPPAAPPLATGYPAILVPMSAAATAIAIQTHGVNDNPALLTANDYSNGFDVLENVEDVNLVCIPDAAARGDCTTIQSDMIQHCLKKRDRFAILDSQQGVPPSGNNSIETQRQSVQADSGFAALYYPWLQIPDPTWRPTPTNMTPATMLIPPSGAMAGAYARVDQAVGVHKAPANVDVQGVVGLERKLSDGQQGPLNLEGIDVLRIFPGSGQVTVWGARTTGDPNVTDWIYVNVRRLMIYIEQSIEVGIRWAVFEPNNLALWQKLKRTITEFLTRVWRDGALFGVTADQAFYVRIDEALNPPSTRALGRLYIEIGVAPVRPAEFIIVRIGLWDGGAQVSES
jgi:uncharacterized protein